MRVGKRAVAAAFVAVAVGASALAASGATVAPLVRVSGVSPYAKCGNGDIGDVVYDNADGGARVSSSPADRDDLVGVWTQDVSDFGGGRGVMASWSDDGGVTWHGSKVPFTKCNTPATEWTRTIAPWASIGADGRVYVASAVDAEGAQSSDSAAGVTTSNDGGRTWSAPKFLGLTTSSGASFAWTWRASVAASPTVAGRAYLVFDRLRFSFTSMSMRTFISTTADGGAHWGTPREVTAVGDVPSGGHAVLVDPSSGAVYLVWEQVSKGYPRARLVVSNDGANTWSTPRTINTLQTVEVKHPVTGETVVPGLPPEVAIDPNTGALYAVWPDARNTGGRRDEVLFSRSTNGGQSWSRVVRVSSLVKRPAFLPTIAVSGDGTVGVLYYDIRFMKAGDGANLRTDVWLRTSADGGRTWSADKHAGGPFNLRAAPKNQGAPDTQFFLGEWEGLTTNAANNFVPFFVQTNCVTGGCRSNRTDVFASVIAP